MAAMPILQSFCQLKQSCLNYCIQNIFLPSLVATTLFQLKNLCLFSHCINSIIYPKQDSILGSKACSLLEFLIRPLRPIRHHGWLIANLIIIPFNMMYTFNQLHYVRHNGFYELFCKSEIQYHLFNLTYSVKFIIYLKDTLH